jgi:glycosyltransferase involved in cell wall biosynthesis
VSFFGGSAVHLHQLRARGNHDPRIATQIVQLSRQIRPHVIQTWLLQMDVCGGIAARATFVPWVLSERSSPLAYQGRAKDRTLRRGIASFAQAIVANSREGLDYWEQSRVPIKRIVPNSVPLRAIRIQAPATDEAAGICNGAKLVLFAGRLNPGKNVKLLVRASKIICTEENVTVMICGEGPLRAELEALVTQLALTERVRFAGLRTDLWALMKRASLTVNPSLFEGQPNVVLEAAAAGCPLVVSDIGAHRACLDSNSAAFFAPTSAEGLATAVLQTLRSAQRSRERRIAAATLVEDLSAENASKAYSQVYELLARKQ